MLRVLPVLLLVGLTIYAVIDCLLTERPRVRHLPKAAWVLLILLVPVAGPAAWLLTGRRPQPAGPDRGRRPARPLAPDDDPDFLRGLGRRGLEERRHTDGHRARPDDEGDDDAPPPRPPA